MKTEKLIGRENELSALERLTRNHDATLILVYGRRRVGKTRLLQQWAGTTGLPVFYWESPRSTVDNVRTSLAREFWRWRHGDEGAASPRFDHWEDLFRHMRQQLGDQEAIWIFDEFPWAVEADDALPSYLKTAWDQLFQNTHLHLFLTGSHISAMEKLLESDAPLFGRLRGKLYVRPLPFTDIEPFAPRYTLEKRLAVWGIIGGIPDYLRVWDDGQDLIRNIHEIFVSEDSPFRNERNVLVSDVLRRDSPDYESVLDAVGSGHHDAESIALAAGLNSQRSAQILDKLQDVRLVERRIRASVPLAQQKIARHGHYHLYDPFLRFYYRFIQPERTRIAQGLFTSVERAFREQMRSFIGATFEDLARAWTLVQARNDGLPFAPDYISSDWGPQHQADVVAVNWREHQVLIGEAKWHTDDFNLAEWRKLVEQADHVVRRLQEVSPDRRPGRPAPEWTRHLALFTRRGITPSVREAARKEGGQIVLFEKMAQDLAALPEWPLR